jgi:hypothetical protein
MRNGHFEPDLVPPPPERGHHDRVRRAERQLVDVRGDIADPFIVVSLLSGSP